MKDAFAVSEFDSPRDFRNEGHALARIVSQRGRDLLQSPAGSELHAEKREAVVALAYFVDGQDVRMIETGRSLRFAAKTGERFAGIGVVTQDAFHCHDAARVTL